MPEMVINTGPIIALTAAMGDLKFLDALYREICIPREVVLELEAGGAACAEIRAIRSSQVLRCMENPVQMPVLLRSQLDAGEASVIHTAASCQISVVAIDEKLGRRFARLQGLLVTGSLGILIKATKAGLVGDLAKCFERMSDQGVWISSELQKRTLNSIY